MYPFFLFLAWCTVNFWLCWRRLFQNPGYFTITVPDCKGGYRVLPTPAVPVAAPASRSATTDIHLLRRLQRHRRSPSRTPVAGFRILGWRKRAAWENYRNNELNTERVRGLSGWLLEMRRCEKRGEVKQNHLFNTIALGGRPLIPLSIGIILRW